MVLRLEPKSIGWQMVGLTCTSSQSPSSTPNAMCLFLRNTSAGCTQTLISSYPAHQLAHRSQLFNCVSPNSEFGPMETKSNGKLYSIQLIYIKTCGLKDLSAYVQYLALAVIIFKLRYDSICVSLSKIG